MTDFSKKSCTVKFFDSLMDDLRKVKIRAIFTLDSMQWYRSEGHRTYFTDTEIYILLENGYCLVIDFLYVDELNVCYRKLTLREKAEYRDWEEKDYFHIDNHIRDFYSGELLHTETCRLAYGSIVEVSLRSVTKPYSKWTEEGLDMTSPTEETFDEIKFTMSNGKSFVISPEDAESDGYALLWSEDADETIGK